MAFKRANEEIRYKMRVADIAQWRVAERYGMNDSNFSRLLRRELPEDKKQKILEIINEIAKESEV